MYTRNIYSLLVLVLVIFSISGFQCNKCETHTHNRMGYNLGSELTQPVYSIGDTITVSAQRSAILDISGGGEYDNRGKKLSFPMLVYKIKENNSEITDGIAYFETVINSGTYTPLSSQDSVYGGMFSTVCDSTTCELSISYIPNTKGYYAFWAQPGILDLTDCVENRLTPTLSENRDNNFSLCQEIGTNRLFISSKGKRIEPIDLPKREDFYFFRVVR